MVLGSILLRDFDETKLDRTEVYRLSGSHVSNIAKEVNALASEGLYVSPITLLFGGNDASRPADMANFETTMGCYRNAISVDNTLAQDVAIAEIPQRQNPPKTLGNME